MLAEPTTAKLPSGVDARPPSPESILAHLPAAVAAWSGDGRLIQANGAFVDLLAAAGIDGGPDLRLAALTGGRDVPPEGPSPALDLPTPAGRLLRMRVSVIEGGTLLTVVEDVTQIRADAEHLRRLALAFEGSSDGIYDLDPATEAVWFSPGWKALIGYADHEVPNRFEEFRRRVHPEDWPKVVANADAVEAARHRHWTFEYRFRHRDGSWRWILARALYLYALGSPRATRVVGVMTDISDRRRLEAELRQAKEEAERANTAKSQFLANMSHELRTPLNAILGFSELIRDQHLGLGSVDRHREFAADINASGQHLLSLIEDALDLSRIEAGRYPIKPESIDLAATVEESLRLFKPLAERNGVRLVIDLPDPVPELRADRRALKQMLINLVSNAVKFTPAGGSVRLSAGERQGGLAIRVADSGIGIRADKIPTLFEPFAHQGASPFHAIPGTGLGLPIVRRLAGLHGGTVRIESQPGSGTVATLWLPPAPLPDLPC